MNVVESLGEEVRKNQVQQVAHALGFTQSEVTSIEQVMGGGEWASMIADVAEAEAGRDGGGTGGASCSTL